MLVLHRRTTRDLFTIRAVQHWVRTVLQTDHLDVPVNLDKLWSGNIRVIVDPDIPLTLKALSAFTDDPDFVVLNTQYGEFSQRFSLAHELIHLFKHRTHLQGTDSVAHYRQHPYHAWMELEANAGAAEILLPHEWFMDTATMVVSSALQDVNDLQTFLTTDEARRWAAQARVSIIVLGYHLLDCGLVTVREPDYVAAQP